jgi:hypothetical protein
LPFEPSHWGRNAPGFRNLRVKRGADEDGKKISLPMNIGSAIEKPFLKLQ